MSFGFKVAGTPAAVTAHIKDLPGYGDTSQLDAVKAFLAAELGTLDKERTVVVEANGHRDPHSHYLKISIGPLVVAPEPATPEAPAEDSAEDDTAATAAVAAD